MFALLVAGQTVEENASIVVRALIRRPECLGPALESDGEGMLQTLQDANKDAAKYFERHFQQLSQEAVLRRDSLLNPDCDDFYMANGRFSPIPEAGEEQYATVNTADKARVRFAEDKSSSEDQKQRISESSPTTELPYFAGVSIRSLQLLPNGDSFARQTTWESASEGDVLTPFSPRAGIDFSFLRLVSSQRDSGTSNEGPDEQISSEPMSMESYSVKTVLKRVTSYPESAQQSPTLQRQNTNDSFTTEQGNKEEDRGTSTLSFYGSLIDLLGRCASAKNCAKWQSSQRSQLDPRARLHSILKSLIPLDDLLGLLKIPFNLPFMEDRGFPVQFVGISPQHKAAVLLFLDRVYGAGSETILVPLLEESFLPDIRVATSLGMVSLSYHQKLLQLCMCCVLAFQAVDFHSDCVVLLNRYIFTSVLPLLTTHAQTFRGRTKHAAVIDALLHTCYHLSRSQQLTARQRQKVSNFLVAFTQYDLSSD